MIALGLMLTFLTAPTTAPAPPTQPTPPTQPDFVEQLRRDLPASATLLTPADIGEARGVFMEDGIGKGRLVEDDAVPGGKAYRVNVTRAGENAWAAQAQVDVTGDIAEGDVLLLAFWVRAEDAPNEAQSAVLPANVVQRAGPTYEAVVSNSTLAGDGWQVIYESAVSEETLPAGSAEVALHLAATAQTVDVGPILVFNLGPGVDLDALPRNVLDYPGRDADAAWRAEAEARIDAHRRGDLAVRVVDAAGSPVEGARVRVEQLDHAFVFGSMIGHDLFEPGKDKMRETFLSTFNGGTVPVYWAWWGWESDNRRATYLKSMDWMNARGLPWRAHTVIYPYTENFPNALHEVIDDPEAVRAYTLDHTREVMAVLQEKGCAWVDLVNEVRHHRDLMRAAGGAEEGGAGDRLIDDAFRAASEVAPDVRLFVNDFGILTGGGNNLGNIDYYHRWLRRSLDAGVPVQGIGFQGHFGAGLTDPARVVAILDDFARYDLPVHITEFDIDTRDEAAQGDYTRDFLTAAYSHPSVEAVVMWGWWEGDMWRPNGALFREDWSPKPSHEAWQGLVRGAWWTDTTLGTDAAGGAAVRGHVGTYRVSVDGVSREVELTTDGVDVELTLPSRR